MSKMRDTCLRYGCIKRCLDTEMPLSRSDIVRIRDLGFSEDFFILKKNGNWQLRSVSGRCVFHDGQRCVIYNHRPEGCRLYPAVLNEEIGVVVLDSYCPHREKFQLTLGTSRRVTRLIRKLYAEKAEGVCDPRSQHKVIGQLNRVLIECPRTISPHGKDHCGRSRA
jgi:Fe-S-cluster containining protein